MRDKLILYGLSLFGLILLPIALRKEPKKDWIVVFLLKSLVSGFFGNIIAGNKLLEFPVRFFPKAFKSSIVYDSLLFPLLCVFYNQTTYKSKLVSIIIQAFIYSLPMTGVEHILEKKTNLIKYNKWHWYYTLITLVITFLSVRGALGIIRKLAKPELDQSV